jgi:hypothetical protein
VKTPEKLLMKIPEMRIAKRIPLRRFSRDIFPEMFSAKFSVTLLAKFSVMLIVKLKAHNAYCESRETIIATSPEMLLAKLKAK